MAEPMIRPLIITAIIAGILAVAIAIVTIQDMGADTDPPTFVSATTDSAGSMVTLTFSEEIQPPDLVSMVPNEAGYDMEVFYRAVFTISVDGNENLPVLASLSGAELTFTLETPYVGAGQSVEVAYDNIFAEDSPGLLQDAAGNVLASFGWETVTNASTRPISTYEPNVILSRTSLTLDEGESASYTVKLPARPDGNRTVGLIIFPWDAVASMEGTLTFTPDNWDQPQTVTITASTDDDEVNAWAIISHQIHGVSSPDTYEKVIRVLVED